MAKKDDGLFLLEVLIDKIVFTKSPCFTDKDFRTCVNIQCSTVNSLEICDDEPGTNIPKSEGPFIRTFNSGKSCLFSLKESEITEAMSKFPIKVSVYKSLPCGCLPTKIVMGEATIDMTKEFVQARNKFLEDPNSVSYQALKDSFRIVGPDGAEAGEILMFLRISCFGKLIVTKFQGSSAAQNLKSAGAPAPVDRSCVPQKSHQTPQDPCVCGATRHLGAASGIGRSSQPSCTVSEAKGLGVCPPARDPFNSMPCEESDDPCYCSGAKPTTKQKMACRNTDKYCLHVPKDCCPPGNKIIFKMPSDSCGTGHKQRSHFNYTTDGVGDIARDDAGQLMPTNAEHYPGVSYDFPSQVVKLRIAKIVEMPGRKSKLEYQFITPAVTQEKFVPTTDTRTAQCVPTSPGCCNVKCTMLQSPFDQDSVKGTTTEKRRSVSPPLLDLYQTQLHLKRDEEARAGCESSQSLTESSSNLNFNENFKENLITGTADLFSNSSTCTISAMRSRHRSVSFSETIDYFWKLQNKSNQFSGINFDLKCSKENQMFGKNETAVYMTLLEEFGHLKNSGTQATGSVNKCLQMSSDKINASLFHEVSHNNRLNKNLMYLNTKSDIQNKICNPEIYFCGKKNNQCKLKEGMGSQQSITKCYRKEDSPSYSAKKSKGKNTSVISTQAKSASSSVSMQTKKSKQASSGTATPKTVSIKTDRTPKPCPAIGTVRDDMMITVSHIKISSKQPCPIHGKDPCQGPKCVAAASQGEEQAPVKISNVNNPRRGVFELVIRKMTGAPLARNELMLEWTPPSYKLPTCSNSNGSYPPAFSKIPSCRLSKYKLIACHPTVRKQKCKLPCKQKYSKKIYKGPCNTVPLVTCPVMPCGRCCKQLHCGKSCSPSRLCSPLTRCALPIPSTCKSPCPAPCYKIPCPPAPSCKNPCLSPCLSSPCLQTCRPCPVGQGYRRRARSHPRVKAHKKRISPCLNKSKACAIVRSRSTFITCSNYDSVRSFCSREYCLSPCKTLGFCRSCCFASCE